MRKVVLLLSAMFVLATSFAVTVPPKKKTPKATEIYLPVGKAGELISLMGLAYAKPSELQQLTGKKMSFTDKMGFKVAQRKLRQSINNDGTINNKQLAKLARKAGGDGTGFHLGGFALGFLLGLIGVLIAYLINDDLKKARTKWAWIGLGVVIILAILLSI